MDKFDRIQKLHRILSARRTPVALDDLAQQLECDRKTVRRAIEALESYVFAPIVYDDEHKGWRYERSVADRLELSGLWLTSEELHGLAIIMQITQSMDSGLLGEDIRVVEKAVEKLLRSRKILPELFREKVEYLPKHRRQAPSQAFRQIGAALLDGKRLAIRYNDYSGRKSQRDISPIKLVHYDENWYVDAWCHLRNELRSFMLARIERVETLDAEAHHVSADAHKEHFTSSYGIFAGKARHTARLRFTGSAAREAASFRWHPDQRAEWQDKTYLLDIPYNDDRELIRTLLGYGEQLEVLGPATLKAKLLTKARQLVALYAGQ